VTECTVCRQIKLDIVVGITNLLCGDMDKNLSFIWA